MNGSMKLGKIASLLALSSVEDEKELYQIGADLGYKLYKGKVGSMDSTKIFAAVETAAKKEGLVKALYREEHAIYHSVLEAYNAICRGQLGLGNVLRSAGLVFSIVRGPRIPGDYEDGEWIAVALYGNMGAPIKGFEHEVIGLGINPV
ncbi:HutP family protein [Desulfotruncus alcoholivorax]|uniref:HutP family protein n=1 Tax=Desulfotruncus alcoholivorax TaxID=265477 RepID=UPI000410121A|nr:HutP family protein [Desulfotruncus alcoholivorax]